MPLDLGPCIVVRGLHLPLSPGHLFTFAWRDTDLGFGHFIDFIILPTSHNRHRVPYVYFTVKKGNCTKRDFPLGPLISPVSFRSVSLYLFHCCWPNVGKMFYTSSSFPFFPCWLSHTWKWNQAEKCICSRVCNFCYNLLTRYKTDFR